MTLFAESIIKNFFEQFKYFPSIFKHLWWQGLSRHASRKTQICGTQEKSEIISSSRSKSVDRNEWTSGGDDATRWSWSLFMFAPIPIVKMVISFLDWIHNYNWESWIFNSYSRLQAICAKMMMYGHQSFGVVNPNPFSLLRLRNRVYFLVHGHL